MVEGVWWRSAMVW